MLRVRFAPSPTGYLHIGSARTFIFNWLYARHNGGTMILRIDDTDLERNTEAIAAVHLRWPELAGARLGRAIPAVRPPGAAQDSWPDDILAKRPGLSRFHAARAGGDGEGARRRRLAVQSRPARNVARKKATAAPPRARSSCVRFRVPRGPAKRSTFTIWSMASNPKLADDIEDFALLRSNGAPTYHLASCADDVDLRISHIIRGQDHLTNTFKHVLIFRAAGVEPPAVRASAAAGRAGWQQAFEAQARAGRLRHHLSRCRLSAAGLHQFPVPARLVAQRRSRADDARRTGAGVLLRRRQPQQRGRQLHRRRSVRPEGRLAERGAHPHHAGRTNWRSSCCPSCTQPGSTSTPRKMAQITPLIQERIRLLQRCADGRRFLLRRRTCRPTTPPN